MKTETKNIKVGDELAFQSGYRGDWYIYEVSHVTPTGISTAGPYKVNADMSIRGRANRGYYGPCRAYHATADIKAKVTRQKCLAKIERTKWRTLDDTSLLAVCAIVDLAKKEVGNE